MALIQCKECTKEISDQAASCPQCGAPIPSAARPESSSSRAPAFVIATVIGFLISLQTPIIVASVPILATIVLAIVAFVRHERGRSVAAAVGALTVLLFLSAGNNSPLRSVNLSSAKIADWNWAADPSFGGKGAIKWNVSVENVTDRPLRNVKVELTTYDASGKLITTTSTYVSAIPPHGTRSDNSFADYFGTEARAEAQITDVSFAN